MLELFPVTVTPEGLIRFQNREFSSISSFALTALRSRNPNRMSCDGWREVKHNGMRMEVLRQRCMRLLQQRGFIA